MYSYLYTIYTTSHLLRDDSKEKKDTRTQLRVSFDPMMIIFAKFVGGLAENVNGELYHRFILCSS